MTEILLDTQQSNLLANLQQEYFLRLELMFILDALLNYLYDCQFYQFFDLAKIFRQKKVKKIYIKIYMTNNWHVKVYNEFLQISVLKALLIHLYSLKSKSVIQERIVRAQFGAMFEYLMTDNFEKRTSGYLVQIPILLKEIMAIWPQVKFF